MNYKLLIMNCRDTSTTLMKNEQDTSQQVASSQSSQFKTQNPSQVSQILKKIFRQLGFFL